MAQETKAPEYRRCSKCGKILPIWEFSRHTKGKNGYEATCRTCKMIRSNYNFGKPACDIDLNELSDEILLYEIRKRGYVGELTQSKIITL